MSVEEAAWLAENLPKSFLKDTNQIRIFVRRALATAAQLRQARLDFDAELRRRSSMLPSTGGAQGAANPELAARFLSPEQLKALFDKFSQEQLNALEDARTRAVEREAVAGRALALAVKALDGTITREETEQLREMGSKNA